VFGSVAGKVQRKLTWFDWANGLSLTRDARLLAFTESGEGAGERYGVFLRPTDGSPAIRLADGSTGAISPDGKWVAAFKVDQNTVQLLPTGAGAAVIPNVAPIETILNVQWFPDSRRLVLVGHEKGKKDRSYELSLGGGAPKPITPEGTSGAFVSPDGKWLVVITEGAVRLFPMDGGPLRDVGLRSEERIAGWLADSRALLVWSRTKPIVVERLDITTAKRTPVTTLAPSEMDGVTALNGVVFTPDGDHYVYTYPRLLSELFVVSGLK
jgi:hypothetical protein